MKRAKIVLAAFLIGINICTPGISAMGGEEDAETETMTHLQIPQKLGIVIDPWEMDGKGQVYSEQYVIQNTGETAGVLELSFTCKAQKGSGVSVRTDKFNLHENDDKSIYMETAIGEDKVILSEEGSAYQAELQPGDKLEIYFTGEVNENAAESWKDGDVDVAVNYSWKAKQTTKAEDEAKGLKGTEGEESLGETENQKETDGSDEQGDQEGGTDTEEEGKTEIIEIEEETESELNIDRWETDEERNISSVQYVVKNVGKTTGTFILSEPICEGGERTVCMELTMEDNEKKLFSWENQENSEYETELASGEELRFRFVETRDSIDSEKLDKEEIKATVNYLWMPKEKSPE